MSTDQQLRPNPSNPPEPRATAKLELSVTKILGGALAAMTAAALGSRLSVAGTLIGAALASVVAAVASALYTASLERAGSRVRNIRTTRTGTPVLVRPEWSQTPAGGVRPPAARPPETDHGSAAAATAVLPGTTGTKRIGWKSVVIGALAIFAITAAVLTTLELVTGHALSGGSGTTIGQVSENAAPSQPEQPQEPVATASPSATAEPSADESVETPEPSATAPETPAPSSAPSATTTPTTPSATPTASGSATPTPSTNGTG